MQFPPEPQTLQLDLPDSPASAPAPGLSGEAALGFLEPEVMLQETALQREQAFLLAQRRARSADDPIRQGAKAAIKDKQVPESSS
jgi:hypothetical protein